MKTIEVGFTTIDYDTPKRLINVATLEDIEKIYKMAEALRGMERDLIFFAVDATLFDIPKDCEFRYDVSYVKCYLSKDGEVSAYQYLQGKYDARDQVESDYIDLKELKKYLIKKQIEKQDRR